MPKDLNLAISRTVCLLSLISPTFETITFSCVLPHEIHYDTTVQSIPYFQMTELCENCYISSDLELKTYVYIVGNVLNRTIQAYHQRIRA